MHVVNYQGPTNLEEFGRIVKIYENRRKTVASVNQHEIERGPWQLVDYVRGWRNNELHVASIDVRRSAIILNSIDFCFEGCNAGMLATFSRENDCAQASAGLKSV